MYPFIANIKIDWVASIMITGLPDDRTSILTVDTAAVNNLISFWRSTFFHQRFENINIHHTLDLIDRTADEYFSLDNVENLQVLYI